MSNNLANALYLGSAAAAAGINPADQVGLVETAIRYDFNQACMVAYWRHEAWLYRLEGDRKAHIDHLQMQHLEKTRREDAQARTVYEPMSAVNKSGFYRPPGGGSGLVGVAPASPGPRRYTR